ncbi:MAG: alpha/beta fold hydrolase [Allosphingosinicella sp.]
MTRFPILLVAALGLALPAGTAFAVPSAAPAARAPAAFAPTRFSVTIVGSGPDVILIPGLAGSSDIWRASVAANPGFRYHLVQVAGFAGTPARGNSRGAVVTPLAEEIRRYIVANRLSRPALVGHSMGGILAMTLAARHPRHVGKVMVVDMQPQPAALVGTSASGVRGLADVLRQLSGTPDGRWLVDSAIRMFGVPENTRNRSDRDVVSRAAHELALTDLTSELPKISAPMTVVYASLDDRMRSLADRTYRSAYSAKPGTRFVRIDNSGHMIMYEQPRAFAAAMRDFLKS